MRATRQNVLGPGSVQGCPEGMRWKGRRVGIDTSAVTLHVAAPTTRSRRDRYLLWTRLATPTAAPGRWLQRHLQLEDVGCGSSLLANLMILTALHKTVVNSGWTACKSGVWGQCGPAVERAFTGTAATVSDIPLPRFCDLEELRAYHGRLLVLWACGP